MSPDRQRLAGASPYGPGMPPLVLWAPMSPRRSPLFPVVVLLLAACGSSDDDAPAKPARLHAAPVTADIVATRGERQSEFHQREVMLLNKWSKRAGLSAGTTASVFDIVKQSRDQTGKARTSTPDQLASVLETVIRQASTKDSGTQAAAYLVADRVLRLAWRPFRLNMMEQKPQREMLKAVGAESFFVEASGETEYAGDWLRAAIHLDPRGSIGQRAVLLELESDCASGSSPDNYHSFIQRLEAVVVSPADSEVQSTAQLLEADAYRDMYALAHGFGKENADSTQFLPEAEVAKVKAIALYEASLAIDSTSRLARGAKLAHDRLVSGQPPDHVRFFCLGD
jgi:hypothetical protein